MPTLGLGDRAQHFALARHNVSLRERMATLTQEVSTGRAADLTAHLRGDTVPLADLDRRLALAGEWGRAGADAGMSLGLMQDVLGQAEAARGGLASSLLTATSSGGRQARETAAATARSAFADVATALNARAGDASLFAGTATDGPALASPQAMMDAIRTATASATTASGVTAALDAWFDPGGGFEAMGYRGTATDLARPVDDGTVVTLAARADAPAIRNLLKAAAGAALALALPEAEGQALMVTARNSLLNLASPLTDLRAGLGQAEARVEEAQARHAARASAYAILRTGMTSADPYETATALEAVRTQLETHYTLTQRLSSLSLVGYLR